jgi:hypothetical protein
LGGLFVINIIYYHLTSSCFSRVTQVSLLLLVLGKVALPSWTALSVTFTDYQYAPDIFIHTLQLSYENSMWEEERETQRPSITSQHPTSEKCQTGFNPW